MSEAICRELECTRDGSGCDNKLTHAARSRLRLELQGLAFAISRGATPEEYARFLWGSGAVRWMGCHAPGVDEYLLKEMDSMSRLFPWIKAVQADISPDEGEVVFAQGCLGGWGENRFALARSLGLNRSAVCRYCAEACLVWGAQLGLKVEPKPGLGCKGGCCLTAKKAVTALAR